MKVKITEKTYSDFNSRAHYLLRSLQNRELEIRNEIERITGLEISATEEITKNKNFLIGNVYVNKNNEVSFLISELSRVRDEKNNLESILDSEPDDDIRIDELRKFAEKRIPILNEEIEDLNIKIGNVDKKIDQANQNLQTAESNLKKLRKEKRKYKKELNTNIKLQKKVGDTILAVNNSYSRSGKVSVKMLERIPFPKK